MCVREREREREREKERERVCVWCVCDQIHRHMRARENTEGNGRELWGRGQLPEYGLSFPLRKSSVYSSAAHVATSPPIAFPLLHCALALARAGSGVRACRW